MDETVEAKTEPENGQGIYEDYFGFVENPFSLTPDPRYLFLSRRHEEALAHLSYGVRERKGFVAIFGEVGTGKTTVCRAFLDMLNNENYEVALIYNPALTGTELLRAINTEFKIDATRESKLTLVEELNRFLLEVTGKGKNVVLIIDEAQNLDTTVLEQLRLVSNLETDSRKLIQIILVGQLELKAILSQHKLRQLNQRIVVRSHLRPFDLHETIEYIRHRLRIASESENMNRLFTGSAYKAIYGCTKGVPRLINILADRALLVAYTLDKKRVTRRIIRKAIADVEQVDRQSAWKSPMKRALALMAILALLTVGWKVRGRINDAVSMVPERAKGLESLSGPVEQKSEQAEVTLAQNIAAQTPTEQEASVAPLSNISPLLETLEPISAEESLEKAVLAITEMWGLSTSLDPALRPNIIASELGMRSYQYNGNIKGIKTLNYPAILELYLPSQGMKAKYVALRHVKGVRGVFYLNGTKELPLAEMSDFWYGRAYIFWKDFENLATRLKCGDHCMEVAWVQNKLRSLGYYDGEISSIFDENTKMAVVDFQKNHHIRVDGIVGPETKMILYSLLTGYHTPSLMIGDEEEST